MKLFVVLNDSKSKAQKGTLHTIFKEGVNLEKEVLYYIKNFITLSTAIKFAESEDGKYYTATVNDQPVLKVIIEEVPKKITKTTTIRVAYDNVSKYVTLGLTDEEVIKKISDLYDGSIIPHYNNFDDPSREFDDTTVTGLDFIPNDFSTPRIRSRFVIYSYILKNT